MPGSREGGKSAAQTIKARDPDFYRRIGAKGGAAGKGGGLTGDPERAKLTGVLGGRKPVDGKLSLARKQRIVKARQALQDLNKQRGMV